LRFAGHLLSVVILLLGALDAAMAQKESASAGATAAAVASVQTITSASGDAKMKQANMETVPRVPGMGSLLKGLNAGVTYSGVHNSQIGWYEAMFPALSYTFSPHYSADVSGTIYLHRLVQNLNPGASATQKLVLDVGDAGDTVIGLHGSYHLHGLEEMMTASLSAPTGNSSNGLGTGRVTFDFDNHLEKFYRHTGVHLSVGAGDSSTLANSLVIRDYSSLGGLAHFQSGATVWGKRLSYIDFSAYEQLPMGSQKVYTIVYQQQGANGSQTVTRTITSGLSEDNGLTTAFGIPLTSRVLLNGYYNRSLRQSQDTVSLGVTFVLQSLPFGKKLSMVDRALREAAGMNPEP